MINKMQSGPLRSLKALRRSVTTTNGMGQMYIDSLQEASSSK